jgi:hypothetical protein
MWSRRLRTGDTVPWVGDYQSQGRSASLRPGSSGRSYEGPECRPLHRGDVAVVVKTNLVTAHLAVTMRQPQPRICRSFSASMQRRTLKPFTGAGEDRRRNYDTHYCPLILYLRRRAKTNSQTPSILCVEIGGAIATVAISITASLNTDGNSAEPIALRTRSGARGKAIANWGESDG